MSYLENVFDLKEKVVVVTGACGQLGSAICRAYKSAGSVVVGTDIELPENRDEDTEYYHMDITNKDEVVDIFNKVYRKHKNIDILINNAGVSTFEPFECRPAEKVQWVMDVNLKGTLFCIQAYIELFDQQQLSKGSVVNIASHFAVVSPDFRNYTDCERKNSEIYGATKAGVIQMTRYFAVHLADRSIRVNSVSPGGIYNPRNPQGEDFIRNYSFQCPMKRMGNESEIIGAMFYFSSDAASYTTGQNLIIDGGVTCW